MASIRGTRTEKNLLMTFAGESQARNRYTFFASVAKKEGYILISDLFTETAAQEKEHAERMFKYLEGGTLEITASYPAGVLGSTLENLRHAADGEHAEWSHDYPACAQVAAEEGFPEIAAMYRSISKAEKYHEERYRKLAERLESDTMFRDAVVTTWRCRHCGYLHDGTDAPEFCPACRHARAYFERLSESF